MKGLINSRGELVIKRGNMTKVVSCPITGFLKKCSDSCALFREPVTNKSTKKTSLQLCYGTSSFSEFNDRRLPKPTENTKETNEVKETNEKEKTKDE